MPLISLRRPRGQAGASTVIYPPHPTPVRSSVPPLSVRLSLLLSLSVRPPFRPRAHPTLVPNPDSLRILQLRRWDSAAGGGQLPRTRLVPSPWRDRSRSSNEIRTRRELS